MGGEVLKLKTFGEKLSICNSDCVFVESWIPKSADAQKGKIFMEIYLHPGMTWQEIQDTANGKMSELEVDELLDTMLKHGLVRYSMEPIRYWPTWRLGDIIRNVMKEIPSIDKERLVGEDGYITEEWEDIF